MYFSTAPEFPIYDLKLFPSSIYWFDNIGNLHWKIFSTVLNSVQLNLNTTQTNITWYRKTSNISRTLVGNIIVDNSDIVGASPVRAAPTTSSFST